MVNYRYDIVCKNQHKPININYLSTLYKFISFTKKFIFLSLLSMERIISMNRWITLSVPNIIVIQLFIEIIHFIDEISFFLLINELLLHWNTNNNSFINKETFFLVYFFQPVEWLFLLSDTEKLIFLLLKCKSIPRRSFWRYMYVYYTYVHVSLI